MLIVGELINASRKSIREAIENKNELLIKDVAIQQVENGADYIDVNAGVFVGKEAGYLKWIVETVQETVSKPCCIDSPDPKVIEEVLSVHKGTAFINSISLEKERWDALIPIVAGTDLKIVALCMSDEGMPETFEDRISIADKLINRLLQNNIPIENIYIDPLVQPVSTNSQYGIEFLKAVEKIKVTFKGVHTICGLSNISFGLPERQFLNQVFIVLAIANGLDGVIVNPLNKKMMANIIAADTLMGQDDFCMNYLKAFRSGQFEL